MTDNEIIKALERCGYHKECCYCNSVEECGSKRVLVANALDLINRLQEKNSNLTSDLTSLRNDLTSAKAEIERLNKEVETELDKLNAEKNDVMYHKAQIKAEAYKEFVERVCEDRVSNDNAVILAKCLLKEMVGENDEG